MVPVTLLVVFQSCSLLVRMPPSLEKGAHCPRSPWEWLGIPQRLSAVAVFPPGCRGDYPFSLSLSVSVLFVMSSRCLDGMIVVARTSSNRVGYTAQSLRTKDVITLVACIPHVLSMLCPCATTSHVLYPDARVEVKEP